MHLERTDRSRIKKCATEVRGGAGRCPDTTTTDLQHRERSTRKSPGGGNAIHVGKHAGRLKSFITTWEKITNEKRILGWIKGYRIPFIQKPIQELEPLQVKLSNMESKNIRTEVEHLLKVGAVSLCLPCIGQFVSNIFLVPKSDGKNRVVINLKKLNKFIHVKHFKLEDWRTALKLISHDCLWDS